MRLTNIQKSVGVNLLLVPRLEALASPKLSVTSNAEAHAICRYHKGITHQMSVNRCFASTICCFGTARFLDVKDKALDNAFP